MFPISWRQVTGLFRLPRRNKKQSRGFLPALEILEDRLTPTTYDVGVTSPGVGNVSNTPGGLVWAINQANKDGAKPGNPDVINLTAGATYTLETVNNYWDGPDGLPAISSAIVINGNGASIARDTSTSDFRLFYVSGGFSGLPTGNLTLNDVTLTGGVAQGGSSDTGGGGLGAGGAIFNQGTVTLFGVTLDNNAAQGGNSGDTTLGSGGGGIGSNSGTGSATGGGFGGNFPGGNTQPGGTTFADGLGGGGGAGLNQAGGSPNAYTAGSGGGLTGLGGNGGNWSGGFLLNNGSTTNGFGADGGGGGGGNTYGGSGGNFGGGGNGTVNEFGGVFYFGGGGGGGSGGGGGGGFDNYNPTAGTGYFVAGGGGGFGGGGGAGATSSTDTSINPNSVSGGGGGFGGGGGSLGGLEGFGGGAGGTESGGGGAGLGGAIFTMFGTLNVTDSTLTQNSAVGGSVLVGNGFGGNGYGGAIFNLNSTVSIVSSTIDANTVQGGINGGGSANKAGGGALYNLALGGDPITSSSDPTIGASVSANATVINSILANSTNGYGSPVNDLIVDVWARNTQAGNVASPGNASTVTLQGGNLIMAQQVLDDGNRGAFDHRKSHQHCRSAVERAGEQRSRLPDDDVARGPQPGHRCRVGFGGTGHDSWVWLDTAELR